MLMVQGLSLRAGCQLISPAEKELTTGSRAQIALENKVHKTAHDGLTYIIPKKVYLKRIIITF